MDLVARYRKTDRLSLWDASTDPRKVGRDLLRLTRFLFFVGCRVVTTGDQYLSVDCRAMMLTWRIGIEEDAGLRNVRPLIEIGPLQMS
jgi:hypothetical protein